MCLLCIEIAKERMNVGEARNALFELVTHSKDEDEKKHYEELQNASDQEIIEIAKKLQRKSAKNDVKW